MGSVYQQLEEVDISGDVFTSKIPLGPEGLLHGTLDNGLRYFVRQCSKPTARAALALAVKVGSLVEEEHERGVAHILEHLAFNATENYSNHDIVAFLENIGASFGACQNAYTSADETVYTLMVPTTDLKLLDQSMQVLAEFAARIRCASEDLQKERGAVLEEWRMNQDSQGRLANAHWKLLLKGSRYENRLPIGLESVIRNVSSQTIADFYRRWYKPQRMAVVVVGDFPDAAAVADMIKQHLGAAYGGAAAAAAAGGAGPAGGAGAAVAAEGEAAAAAGPDVPKVTPENWQHSEPRYCVFADREAPDSCLYLSWKMPSRPTETPAQYLEVMKDGLFMSCLNHRLYRLSRVRDPAFFSATMSDESACRAVDMFVLGTICEEKKTLRALEAVLTELARVRLYGFSQREFNNAVKGLQADIESTYIEADQGYCTDIRDEYVRHFLGQEFVSGQQYEARLNKTLLPLITVNDINLRAARLTHQHSAVYKTVEHKKWSSESAMRAMVLQVAAAEQQQHIGPWEEPDMPDSVMKQIPQVPDEWYTSCGQHPPEHTLQSPSAAAAAVAAAAVASPLSPKRSHLLRGGGSGFTEFERQQITDLRSPSAAAAAGHGGSSSREWGSAVGAIDEEIKRQQQQQGQEAQDAAAAPAAGGSSVDKPIRSMIYPGVESERHYSELKVRELTLVNGLVLAIKETDFLDDEVLITAGANGGLSEVPRPEFYTCSMSGVVATQLGPFGHKPDILGELLAGRRLSLSPAEGAYARAVKGSCSPQDLEVALQLINLLMTSDLKLEAGEMDSVMVQLRQGIEAQLRSPLHAYHTRIRQINYEGCYFFDPITLDELEKVNLESSCRHHRATYSNPAEFTLIFTGNVKFAQLLPLLTTYLATIPAAAGRGAKMDPRKVKPLPFSFPDQPVVEDVEVDMVSPVTQIQITFPIGLSRSTAREELWWLSSLCRILETRLLQKLRFEFGDIYTVSVSNFFGCEAPSSNRDKLWGDVSIAFTCDPANKDRLVSMTLATLELLQNEGPTQAEVDTVLKLETLDWENLCQENSFWHDVIANGYQSRRFAETNDLDAVWTKLRDTRDAVISSMTPEGLRNMLQVLFPYPCRSRYTAITMMPKPPGVLGRLAFKFATASPAVQAAVAVAGVGVVAAAIAAAVVARRRAR